MDLAVIKEWLERAQQSIAAADGITPPLVANIRDLVAEVERLREERRWRPMAECDANDMESVLVVAKGMSVCGIQMSDNVGEAFKYRGEWYWMAQEPADPEREEPPIEPVGWMPLPDAPLPQGAGKEGE